MLKSINKFISGLIKPRSTSDDDRRREFILNVILLSSLILSGLVAILILFRSARMHSFNKADAASALTELFIFGIFLFLYVLSRLKLSKVASYLLLTLYFIPVTQALYAWGIDLPQGLLIYVLIIVASGVLISSNFAFVVSTICSLVIFFFNFLMTKGLLIPNSVWKQKEFGWPDAIIFSATFFIIAVIAWLSNREIEKSLRRARKSEAALKNERDLLEIKVEERTREIKKIQLEKMEQLSHFAEIGELTAGIFHDLINPLTAVSLNLNKLKSSSKKLADPQNNLAQAIKSTKHIESLMSSLKSQISHQEIKKQFLLSKTIKEVIQILSYKAKLAKVEIEVEEDGQSVTLYGNPIKFHQSLSNILSNAIDAYNHKENDKKPIELRLTSKDNEAILYVYDWGEGIPSESIKNIFDPFFTTKEINGTGLGLAIAKNIIEKDFNGSICVESSPELGTIFQIKVPISKR